MVKRLLIAVVSLLAAYGAVHPAGAQTSTTEAWDLSGIDQGLRYFAKFDEFGEGPNTRTPRRQLVLGEPVVQELRGAETTDYGVSLSAGQLMEVVAERRGIHVSLALFGPGPESRELVEVDSVESDSGIETLKWIAYKTGLHIIEVSSPNASARPGSFSISLRNVRQSEPQDRRWVAAQQMFSNGFDVSKRLNQEAQWSALDMLEEARKQWELLGETEREVETRHAIGRSKYTLGVIYEGGHGAVRNEEMAKKLFEAALEGWYRAAAERGELDAQTVMGDVFLFNRGAPRDSAQAYAWYRRAADQGGLRAANNLGCLYLQGLGRRQDYAEAIRWFRKAAEGGNAVAKRNTGMMYKEGKGVEKDPAVAAGWWRQAADQGDEDALRLLHP